MQEILIFMDIRRLYIFLVLVLVSCCLVRSQGYNGWVVNENLKYKLDGRMTIDGSCFFYKDSHKLMHNNELIKLPNGFSISNARLGISAEIYKKWHAEMDISFSEDGSVSFKDIYLRYNLNENNSFSLGNLKDPVMLANITSSRYLNMERPVPVDYFHDGRHIAFAWDYSDAHNYANINVSFAEIGNHLMMSKFRGNDFGLGFRYVYRNTTDNDDIFHVGLYNLTRFYGYEDDGFSYNAYSSNGLNRLNINELFLTNLKYTNVGGIEFLTNLKKIRLQGEAIYKYVNLRDKQDERHLMYGGYFNLAYSLFSENSMSYDYKKACLEKNDKKSLELFTQVSYLNLDDFSPYDKCNMVTTSLGVTWYPNKFILGSLFYDCTLYRNKISKNYSWNGGLLPIHSINARVNVYF